MSTRNGNRDGVVEYRRRDDTIVYSIRFRDANGRQHQERSARRSRVDPAKAAQVCRERRVDVRREGLRHTVGGPTLATTSPASLDVHPTVRGLKPKSVEHYSVALGRVRGARRPPLADPRAPPRPDRALGPSPRSKLRARAAHRAAARWSCSRRCSRGRSVSSSSGVNPCGLIDRPRVEEFRQRSAQRRGDRGAGRGPARVGGDGRGRSWSRPASHGSGGWS